MTRTRDTTVAAPVPTLRPVQAAAVLSVLVLLWQFLSAGRILVGEDAVGGHGAGAIALHVTTGLLLAATVLLGRRTRVWWPAALAAAVFVLTFVQAALGSSGSITTHVPLALVVTVGVVWLAAWSFRAP
jgi:predicted anti-sigma-YlaC factor YlaD